MVLRQITVCVLFVAAGLSRVAADPIGEPLVVSAQPVPLNSEDPSQSRVGDLTYLKGWRLESAHRDFGGWSAMVLRGETLTLFSDAGAWMMGTLDLDAAKPLTDARIGSIASRDPDDPDKELVDLESALPEGDQGFLVAFEQDHRLERMAGVGGMQRSVPMPPEIFKGLSKNGGFEAMARDGSGRLILFAEKGRGRRGHLFGWRVAGLDGARTAVPLRLALEPAYSPTALKRGSEGRMILVARAYSLMQGVRVKILSFPESSVSPQTPITPVEHGHLAAPLSVDNFEALAVIPGADADTLLILSDDNFSSRQATLLLAFSLSHAP